MQPIALQIGSLAIYWYGILLVIGVVLGLSLSMEFTVFRPLRTHSPAVMLVATFAVSFLLQSIALLVVLTEWDEFRWVEVERLAEVVGARRVLDTRNVLDAVSLRRRGWEYEGVGR